MGQVGRTMLLAALDQGAGKVIGIDREEKYLDVARRRVASRGTPGSGPSRTAGGPRPPRPDPASACRPCSLSEPSPLPSSRLPDSPTGDAAVPCPDHHLDAVRLKVPHD